MNTSGCHAFVLFEIFVVRIVVIVSFIFVFFFSASDFKGSDLYELSTEKGFLNGTSGTTKLNFLNIYSAQYKCDFANFCLFVCSFVFKGTIKPNTSLDFRTVYNLKITSNYATFETERFCPKHKNESSTTTRNSFGTTSNILCVICKRIERHV